jgi:CRP-like cAMP-binding protein
MKFNPLLPNQKDGDLKNINAFQKLTQKEIEFLETERVCNTMIKGTFLFREGNRNSGFYCIHKGIIKQFKTGINGKEHIIRFTQTGDIIGYRSILSNEPACTTAQTIDDSIISFVPARTLIMLVKSNPDFSMFLMQLVCKELEESNRNIVNIAQKTVKERLAEVLLLLKKTFELDNKNYIQISLTREEFANMIGTATESVIRLFSEFKSANLISINGRKIKIIDEDGLIKIAKLFDY